MKLFICVDDEGGMTFMGRRVSRDIAVVEDMAATSPGGLTVFPYSLPLFKNTRHTPRVVASYENISDTDCLFIEDKSALEIIDRVDTLVIYRWNRLYPSDRKIDFNPAELGFLLTESADMVGKSHERITKEIYKR